MQIRTFQVLLSRRESVEAAMVALNKRGARKSLPPIGWSWGKAYSQREHVGTAYACQGTACRGCQTVDRIPFMLEGDAPRYDGWTFAAALQHLEGENIVRTVPGIEIPANYRTRGSACDHCRVNRRRNDTYVLVHEDGRTVQVGSTCIGDFLGSDRAGAIADSATLLAIAGSIAEDGCEFGGGSGSTDRTIATYLPIVAYFVRVNGWMSRTAARDRGDGCPATADDAWHVATSPREIVRKRFDPIPEPTAEDIALAESAESWAESLSDAEVDAERGDYLHNVRAAARTGMVTHRTAGIIASIVTAYQRAIGKERMRKERAERPASVHVGTVGKRETWANVLLDFVTGYEGAYGYVTVLKFRTESGAILTWKATSTDLGRDDVGKRYTLTGTVKAHDDYKGEKQTLVTRCKAVELPSPATVAA